MLAQQGKLAELVQQHLTLKKHSSVSVNRVHRCVIRVLIDHYSIGIFTKLIDKVIFKLIYCLLS